jgi:circadian clock protein KaiB
VENHAGSERDAVKTDQGPFLFRLYVSGWTHKAQVAHSRLERVCSTQLGGTAYTLEVIDLIERPQAAMEHQILATPTLVRVSPPPTLKMVGDFSDERAFLSWLELDPGEGPG